jgi:hypothetical protein
MYKNRSTVYSSETGVDHPRRLRAARTATDLDAALAAATLDGAAVTAVS